MKKLYKHFLIINLLFFVPHTGQGAINSVILTPATPTTMSTGMAYYLAGKQYIFKVQVSDPDATAWTNITNVQITIPNTPNIVVAIAPSGTGAQTITSSTGPVDVTASIGATDTYNNFTVTFNITIRWDTGESSWSAGRNIIALASSSNSRTDTRSISYGVCSSIRLLNFAMSGEASDGKLNRWHNTFNVTGNEIVYNVPGAAASDAVSARADNALEINATALIIGTANAGAGGTGASQNVSVPAAFFNTNAIPDSATAYNVFLRTTMLTNAATEDTYNYIPLICDRIRITNITFLGGNGIDNDPTGYYRSTNVSGTQVRIDANMLMGGGNMDGDTTIELRDTTDGNITTVIIPSGQNYGTAILNITAPGDYTTTLGANSSQLRSYEIYNVYGGAYGSTPFNNGQWANNPSRITQPVTHSIYWDNIDPPGTNTGDFNGVLPTPFPTTAGSVRINWTAIPNANPDIDFDTYKVYYRVQGSPSWTIVDRNTATYATLGTIGTNTVLLNGLQPLTNYEIRLTAVDIFGNETQSPNTYTATTGASEINLKVTDGITSYSIGASALDPDPSANFRIRLSNIRIDSDVITSGNTPERVEILLADNATDIAGPSPAGQWGSTGSNNNLISGTFYTLPTTKTGPNTWTGYIPTGNPLMVTGTTLRFILRIYYASFYVDVDANSTLEAPGSGDPTDHEWRFYIYNEPVFTPWPVRILNNVITDDNPVAYPAYYLTDDAYVSIKAYDIKGRVVAVLLENAYRKAGQNIKEQGWRGTNKYNKKLGVGLYYIHVKAKRASDGKVILDTFKKVVMAK